MVRLGVTLALALVIVGALTSSALAASVTVRIETPQRTIFSGPVTLGARSIVDTGGVPYAETNNVMSALQGAADAGAFPLTVSYSLYGAYIQAIDGVQPIWTLSEPDYWVLRVNGAFALTGASAYKLKDGDSVLWYAGTDTASPAVAAVPSSYVAVGTTATVVAESLDASGVASVLPAASVYVGSRAASSAVNGTAGFRFSAPGDYGVRVEKDGYIRSAFRVLHVRYTTKLSSLAASKTRVKRGSHATLSGKLSGVGKAPSKRRIDLLVRKPGSSTWTTLTHKTSSSTGTFKFSVKVSASRYYRVTFAGDSTFAASTSASRLIRLR